MGRRDDPTFGEQELAVLTYVAARGGVTARDAADHFAETQGLARTTVATVLERLRAKGALTRERDGGSFRYRTAAPRAEVERGVVGRFVAGALGGSRSPLLAYLADAPDLTPDEIAELRRIVEGLDDGR